MQLGDISVNYLYALTKAVDQLGYDISPIFQQYGVTNVMLETPDARISIPKFMRIGHDAIQLTNTPHLGLAIGTQLHVGDIGLTGFAALTAENLWRSLQLLTRYELLTSHNCRGHSTSYLENGLGVMNFYSISPYNTFNYFVVDTILSGWFKLATWLSGEFQLLDRIEVEYEHTGYAAEYEKHFKCPIHFGAARNALIFKRTSLKLPCRYANTASNEQARNLCDQALQQILGRKGIREKVMDIIGPMLHGTPPSMEDVARKMGIGSWTLRRTLAKENILFQNLLDQTRRELAESYVRDTLSNFSEIAFMVGFSTPHAFQKAFKRWSGMSPGEYRRRFSESNQST